MPGNVVETETCSNEDKKIAQINDRVTTNSFLVGTRDDWSSIETDLRSGLPPPDRRTTSCGAVVIPAEGLRTETNGSLGGERDIRSPLVADGDVMV
jgi:hypothetical protein